MQTHQQAVRFDPKQIEVEKCVDVRPEQQAILGTIVVDARHRPNVCRFEQIDDFTTRNNASVVVSLSKRIPELRLPLAAKYLLKDMLSRG